LPYLKFIYSAHCLTTRPYHLPKRVLHRVRSSASFLISSNLSFPSGHLLAFYVLILPLHHFYRSLYPPSNNMFQKAVPTQNVTIPISLPSCLGGGIFLSSFNVFNMFLFFTRSVQLIFFILLQHHISKLSRYF